MRLSDGRMNLAGSNIHDRRSELSMSQDQLCALIAAVTNGAWIPTRHDIYRIEVGTRTVSDAELLALACVLETDLNGLVLGGTDASIKQSASDIFAEARPSEQ